MCLCRMRDGRAATDDNGDFIWGEVKVGALLFLVGVNVEKHTSQREGGYVENFESPLCTHIGMQYSWILM